VLVGRLEVGEDVEGVVVGHASRHAGQVQRGGVDLHRQGAGLSLGHPADTKAGMQLSEGAGEPIQVRLPSADHAVSVPGRRSAP
jgi:hypothetical protein